MDWPSRSLNFVQVRVPCVTGGIGFAIDIASAASGAPRPGGIFLCPQPSLWEFSMRFPLLSVAAAAALLAGVSQVHAATYTLDPDHTFVTFEIGHFGTSTNRGRFDKKEGTVQFDRAGKTGKVDIVFHTASINTGTEAFNQHLQSADLLDSAKFPTARFVANKFDFSGDKVTQVTGNLTLMGQTHPITLKASNFNCYDNPKHKREVCGGDFETTLDRSQFGINYAIDWGFSKNVRLLIQVEAIKQ
jgi:polyisoprenoid-binding protein YceI